MTKSFLLSILMLTAFGGTYAQTTATDFTATDCNGASRSLFAQLDSGRAVVLVWVMPCGACISDAKAGYDEVETALSSHPGKVVYWLSDDAGDNSCASVSNWATTNSINVSNITVFDNSGNTINESNYGGTGMPHVVVIGKDRHIYYNQKNGSNDGTAIANAITQALTAPTRLESTKEVIEDFSVYPNPASKQFFVSYNLKSASQVDISVYTLTGARVMEIPATSVGAGYHLNEASIDLPGGVYIVKVTVDGVSRLKGLRVD